MTKTTLIALVAIFYLGNGVFMVAAPLQWYSSIPGVIDSGPANLHFIRDIGFIYLLSGSAVFWAIAHPAQLSVWLAIGNAWPALHGAFHLIEWVSHGLPPLSVLVAEFFGVIAPVLIGIGAMVGRQKLNRGLQTC